MGQVGRPGGEDPLAALLAAPHAAAVLTDFDGTLAHVVDDPLGAVGLPGVSAVLGALTARYAVCAVVSGRPTSFLRERLGPGLRLSGLYGLEDVLPDGRATTLPEAAPWRPVVASAVARAGTDLGPVVEAKGLSMTLHHRTAPARRAEVRAWAEAECARSGLVLREAKASIELHPPVHADKGTVVEALVGGLRAACFLGDDVGDLPAFDALDRLAAAGVHTVRIGVDTSEAPPVLLARADLVVDGPEGALEVLRRLAA